MNVTSIFDILEPVMVGPSSSHTAGAVRIGLLARAILGGTPKHAEIILFNSFAQTGKGHGTDKAILAGLLGFNPDDIRLRNAYELAKKNNLKFKFLKSQASDQMHPNTAKLILSENNEKIELWASSLGAGRIILWKIDEFRCDIDGTSPAILIWHKDKPGLIGNVASVCGKLGINISNFSSARNKPGGDALMTAILDQIPDNALIAKLEQIEDVQAIRFVAPVTPPRQQGIFNIPDDMYKQDIPANEFARKIIDLESQATNTPIEQITDRLDYIIDIMQESINTGRASEELSASGLVGIEHALWRQYCEHQFPLTGKLINNIIRDALAVAGLNAKMGRIVAAPTAGASGVLPAVIFNIAQYLDCTKTQIRDALAIAGLIGAMIGKGASLSGAECGCQAECGSASAMAGASACFLKNQSSKTILNAAALALKNHLGLTCDPVAGLVEIPCVKRNAFSAVAAITAAELASANIISVIPFKQVIEAMYQTGKMIAPALRESAQAGLASTETAKTFACSLRSINNTSDE